MGQKITIKKKKFWRKKSTSKAMPEQKTGIIERIKSFFKG
jgi:hypothetical protein